LLEVQRAPRLNGDAILSPKIERRQFVVRCVLGKDWTGSQDFGDRRD
jgi:hypothetical protein